MQKKLLTQCLTEADRREHYPQLSKVADWFEATGNPAKVMNAVSWIITRRKIEKNPKKEMAKYGKENRIR